MTPDETFLTDADERETELTALRARVAELEQALKGLFAVLEPEIPGSPDSPLERARAAIAKAGDE